MPPSSPPARRADAERNAHALVEAAAEAFLASGVDAPVRDVAARAGVGVGTVYRHFPTRADLVIAVYRHQVDECAQAGPALLASAASPYDALVQWIDLFVGFVATKHGLAAALRPDDPGSAALHAWFLDRLVPVCEQLLGAAQAAGQLDHAPAAYELMRAVGNLCIGGTSDERYDPRRAVALLLRGLRA